MAREVICECDLCLMIGRSTQAMFWCTNSFLKNDPRPNIRICQEHYEAIVWGRKVATKG